MKEMMKNVHLEDPQLPSALKDARRNHGGMTVPEDFFAQFEQKVNAMIDAEVAQKESEKLPSLQPQTPTIGRRPGFWISIAASVVVAIAVGLVYQLSGAQSTETNDVQPVNLFAELDNETVIDGQVFELPDEVSDELMAAASDFEIFDLYCDI